MTSIPKSVAPNEPNELNEASSVQMRNPSSVENSTEEWPSQILFDHTPYRCSIQSALNASRKSGNHVEIDTLAPVIRICTKISLGGLLLLKEHAGAHAEEHVEDKEFYHDVRDTVMRMIAGMLITPKHELLHRKSRCISQNFSGTPMCQRHRA